jgi:hypothetical protein
MTDRPCNCPLETTEELALHPLTCPSRPVEDAAEDLLRMREAVAAGWHPLEALGAFATA